MHEVVQSATAPLTALSLALKVGSDALPEAMLLAIFAGDVDLGDPQTILLLLQLNAVAE